MDGDRLINALTPRVGPHLARDLVVDFLKIRLDCSTHTLERSSPGKFVETLVQCLQYIETGAFDTKPSVDAFLLKVGDLYTNVT